TVLLDKQVTQRDELDKVLRVHLHPDLVKLPALLEISYTIPADALARSNYWSTTLLAPVFRSDVVIGQMQWQFTTPAPMLAATLGRNVHSETHWSVQGWLLAPESVAVDP